MKNLIKIAIILLSLTGAQFASADANMAKLKMKLTGPVNNRSIYLCVSNNGCSNISAAANGKVLLMDTGAVKYIFAADMKNMTMQAQTLPTSCQVKLTKDQTLVVSGRLVTKKASSYINGMKCHVT